MNDSTKYECCKSFTEIAIESKIITFCASDSDEEKALKVATFFNTLAKNLGKQE